MSLSFTTTKGKTFFVQRKRTLHFIYLSNSDDVGWSHFSSVYSIETWLYKSTKWWHPLIYIRRTYNITSELIRLKCKLSSFQKLLIVSINQFDITLNINIHWLFLFWIFLYEPPTIDLVYRKYNENNYTYSTIHIILIFVDLFYA